MMVETLAQTELEDFSDKILAIRKWKTILGEKNTLQEKLAWVLSLKSVQSDFERVPQVISFVKKQGEEALFVFGLLSLTGHFDALFEGFNESFQERLIVTLDMLKDTERFYSSKGGLLGYIEKTLQIFCGQEEHPEGSSFLHPPFYDMREKTENVWQATYEGIRRLGEVGELYVVGGAGDRLKLHDERTGAPVPVAYFPFCGKLLFEHLFRDLEAREYVHFRCFGKNLSTPVLLMTSQEKENDRAISEIVEKFHFFGREKTRIRRVVQSLVPLIAANGKMVFQRPMELAGKPGGHGVIWKIAHDSGAFIWLKNLGTKALLVRQINNPLAGLDHALSALVGFGVSKNKAFGFASCARRKGFAEGLNVALTKKERSEATISNIEYTKFEHLTEEESKILGEREIFANTNILFANIDSIEKELERNPIPGMIVNAKNQCDVLDGGKIRTIPAARLESTMQNIADTMMEEVSSFDPVSMREELSTFLHLYDRSKLFSVTKKAYQGVHNPYETPESCFYDWYIATCRLLEKECHFSLQERQTLSQFLQDGPNVSFFFHPALGPFWEVISQKIFGGTLELGSELELEIAEIHMRNLFLNGSLRILSDSPTGIRTKNGVRTYSRDVGRVFMKDISIHNAGLSLGTISDHVRRKVKRKEGCTIYLEGFSELIAEGITISGDFSLTVPHGKRAILSQDVLGGVKVRMEEYRSPSWEYIWNWDGNGAPELTRV